MSIDPLTATASELQARLTAKAVTSKDLVDLYLGQIARHNDYLKAIIATTPRDLLYQRAVDLDKERADGVFRGPLHGIPVLLKDNIASAPELGLPTTCGSLALVGSKPSKNAAVVSRLIAAGAIILGKANLSVGTIELADSGWSAVGGQTQSPYVRGGFREDDSNGGHSNPGGSSSGSAVGVAAGFAPISIGTETMGSLMMPSDRAALYTIKPTLKIVPQDGMIPVTLEADSAGPMTKSVMDLADLLDVLVDASKTTVPKGGYKSAVTGSWGDIKIGYVEPEKWLFPEFIVKYEKSATDQMLRDWRSAFDRLRSVAKVVKPVELVSIDEETEGGKRDIFNAFHWTFKGLLEDYLASIKGCKISTLEELIKFNEEHADQELPPSASNQAGLIRALNTNMTDDEYHNIIRYARTRCGKDGIDKVLEENDVDIIMGPGDGPMFTIAGTAGYPSATLPLGYLDFNGRPFGLQIIAKAHQEALLIQAQSAWESTFPSRQPPPLDEIDPQRT
ncbi:amidase family protein [Alternaria alternata]|uniref:Amidase family protein n=1 Tax=Alternaria alternata TaxID=5599 RepID=A0A177D345_ALTAL|nr:amidase family protein [Alternaria alternata]OAG13532.1 amidase family protein [Alternaria alternata]